MVIETKPTILSERDQGAVKSELMQLHHMNGFGPIQQSSMTKRENLEALNRITKEEKMREDQGSNVCRWKTTKTNI
jgi:hypothetical protein